jgi:bile acid:Na+ symporter, BASS family
MGVDHQFLQTATPAQPSHVMLHAAYSVGQFTGTQRYDRAAWGTHSLPGREGRFVPLRSQLLLPLSSGSKAGGSRGYFRLSHWIPLHSAIEREASGDAMISLMTELLNIAIPLFAVSSMAAVGFRYTFRQIAAPFRNLRGVILVLFANFVLVPMLAFIIVRLFSLEQPLAIGLILVALAAGAPFAIKLTQISGGDTAFSAGILVILLIVTIAYMPLVVPWLEPGIAVNARRIARPLVLTMLLPLGIALLFENLWPGLGERMEGGLSTLTSISLIAVIALTFVNNLSALLGTFGTRPILAALLLLAGAFIIGYAFGIFGKSTRNVVGLNTAQRNYAAAMIVATETFANPDVLVMVVVASVISTALLFPGAWWLKRYSPHAARKSAPKSVSIEIPRRKRRAS